MIEGGKQCALRECRQLDFLPFECSACGLSFCQDHRYPSAHSCTAKRNNQIPDSSVEKKNKNSVPKCPVKSCKNVLTPVNEYICELCKVKVCLQHRFQESHDCVALKQKKEAGPGQNNFTQIEQKKQQKKKTSFFCCFSGKTSKKQANIVNKEPDSSKMNR